MSIGGSTTKTIRFLNLPFIKWMRDKKGKIAKNKKKNKEK
jgi:hypothetical protein